MSRELWAFCSKLAAFLYHHPNALGIGAASFASGYRERDSGTGFGDGIRERDSGTGFRNGFRERDSGTGFFERGENKKASKDIAESPTRSGTP